MILDSAWIFSDAQAMPNSGSDAEVECTNCIDLQAAKNKDWINSPIPLWIIVTVNTVPSAGTSLQVRFYQHSTTTLASGTVLLDGRVIAKEDMSVSPKDEGHVLFCAPLLSCLCTVQAADRTQYCGPVLKANGDLSSGKVDAWLHMGVNPPVWVPRPAIVDASNIVMPV